MILGVRLRVITACAVLSNDLPTTKFKIKARWKCGYTGVALI
jgi:hypothetical protein